MMRTRVGIAALAAAVMAAACSSAPGDAEAPGVAAARVPAEAASIVGEVKQVEPRGTDGMRILVEQEPTRSAGEPVAWIDVTPQTRVLVRAEGRATAGSAAELAVGMSVSAWFEGPVRESFPVQATGGTIVVER
jgi:hypothetical protein